MVEEWRPVAGFSDYAVSSFGQVKRVRPDAYGRMPGGVLHAVARPDGYFAYSLHNRGKQKVVLAHRIVCESFHGPAPSRTHHVAHGDGDKANNTPSNLRWATPSDNNLDKWQHGTMRAGPTHHARTKPECMPRGERHGNAKLTAETVRLIRADKRPQKAIARQFGVSQSLICQIKNYIGWSHVQ